MKKTFLFILVFLFMVSLGFGDVFMTELADPNNNSNARYIELYNNGSTAVDFTEGSNWRIDKYTNASPTVSYSINLTGTIAAGDFYIIAYDLTSGTFLSVYGFAADQLDAVSNGVVGANGDDPIELVDGTGTVVDQFGVPGIDGTGFSQEYEDGRAERVATVLTGQATYADENWNTWSDGPGGDVIQTQDAPGDFDPDSWIGTGGNILPSISNITQVPASGITSSTTVAVSADVTDADGTISLVELHWGLTSGSLGTTISMSNGGSGDTYTTTSDIPAQSDGITVYYEVYAEDDVPESKTSLEYYYFVSDAAGPTAGVVFISEVSDENTGGYTTAYMEIYNNSVNYINMENSYIERWSGGAYNGYTYTFGSGVIIPAEGVLIVARGADQATFEAAWSITISSLNASFDQGSTSLYFTTGRSYKLFSPSSRDEIDSTPEVDAGNRIVQTSVGTWSSQESSSNATPGNLDGGQALPVTLSNFTAQFVNDNLTILWTTQSETNNLGWNIYRGETENALENNTTFCINNSGLIPGAGTTSGPTNYQFTDEYDVTVGQTYWYWLESIDGGGNTDTYGPATLTVPEEEPVPQLPQNTFLCRNYPNPFNPETMIEFSIKENETGTLTIYNTKGQLLETYQYEAGEHELTWDAIQYGSGIYFYKLKTQSYTETKKMIMLK